MFSNNLYTRRRQQAVVAFATLSGVLLALGAAKALQTPALPLGTLVSTSAWRVEVSTNNVVVVRDAQTGQQQSILTPMHYPELESITSLKVTGNQVVITLRKVAGQGNFGYILRDCDQTWDATTGTLRRQEYK